MYIKITSHKKFQELVSLCRSNEIKINGNLEQFKDFNRPDFVFLINDKPPAVPPEKQLIWDTPNLNQLGNNYWHDIKDWDKIYKSIVIPKPNEI